jgi:hypothetical protein
MSRGLGSVSAFASGNRRDGKTRDDGARLRLNVGMGLIEIGVTLAAGALAIADLATSAVGRRSLAARFDATWRRVEAEPSAAFVAAAAGYGIGVVDRIFGAVWWRPRFIGSAVAGASILGGAVLMVAAGIASKDPGGTITQGLRYFGVPAAVAGWLSLAAGRAALVLAERADRVWLQAGCVSLFAVLAAVLWLAVVHAGAWVDWQERRTPIAFGTEWFYAELYAVYVRDAGGLPVTLATIAVAWTAPVLAAALIVSVAAAKTLRPVLAALAHGLLVVFARARRGMIAAFAVGITALVLLVGVG